MFKFDFDIDDAEDIDEALNLEDHPKDAKAAQPPGHNVTPLEPHREVPIHQLFDALPPLISYSALNIPLTSSRKSVTLIRRDLFDARFQLISEGAGDTEDSKQDGERNDPLPVGDRKALEFIEAPSDLVPGVYEGGLKTWECSLDLVDYLDSLKTGPGFNGFEDRRILELGCGTGIPSLYILRELLSSPPRNTTEINSSKAEIHFQDYNGSVLQLVTLPNIILTWYASTHADAYRTTIDDPEVASALDFTAPGELPITPELKAAFLSSLQTQGITLRFFSGAWDSFDPNETSRSRGYDILLTSETIYRLESLPPLINVMRSACTRTPIALMPTSIETLISSKMQITDSDAEARVRSVQDDYLCLVAAKVLYFGVGGGVPDFLAAVEESKGKVETVLERRAGVGRKVMSVKWH